jgi:hypothetical protein
MKLLAAALSLLTATSAMAVPALKPEMAPLGFLVGKWTSDDGKVADTGGTSRGESRITIEADGGALLRRDHTQLTGKDGKPAGGFSQLMMIYPEGDTIRAVYEDGEGHVIHYETAKTDPGKSVTFTSASQPGAPIFQLTYELKAENTLTVTFGHIPPGQTAFHAIAVGTLKKE